MFDHKNLRWSRKKSKNLSSLPERVDNCQDRGIAVTEALSYLQRAQPVHVMRIDYIDALVWQEQL